MGITRPLALIIAGLLLLAAPVAADSMIYWEDPCDSLDNWYKQYGHSWTVSSSFSHGETAYGIGHAWTTQRPGSYLYCEIPLPPSSSGVQAEYLDFYVQLKTTGESNSDIKINGVSISNYNSAWDISWYTNQWIYVHYPVSGLTQPIRLDVDFWPATSGSGSSIMIDTIRLKTTPVVPAFTASPTSGSGAAPLTVQFTDTTQWSDSIIYWDWDFGDGQTSTERNPTHTYAQSFEGSAYDVSLTVTTKWNEGRTTYKPAYITTDEESDFVMDFTASPLSGDSPLVVNFTATVSPEDTDLAIWKWDFGDGGIGYGQTASHTYNTYGLESKYDVTLIGYTSASGKNNETTKAGYITVNGSSGGGGTGGSTSLSTVKLRLIVMDYVGQRFDGVTVTATPLESTGPWAWLEDLFGVPGTVDVQNEVLTGTTGSDGGIVFALIESVKYRIDITDPEQGISTSITLYPKEDEVPIYIWPATTPPLGKTVDYTLTANPINDERTNLQVSYRDGLENTTSITFYVKNESGHVIHSETRTRPGNITLTYEMENDPGSVYYFGFEAQHGIYGQITQDQFIRFENNRPMVDFADWIPLWVYNWIAIGLIVSIAAIFGFQTLKFGVVIVPVFALAFTFIGWLNTSIMLTLCAMTLGVMMYLRYSEGETGA